MSQPLTNVPILFVVFKRPDTTRQVFESIRQVRPARLYVAADGPRPGRPGEHAACMQVRQIATQVDWPCEVRTLFREANLGSRGAVSTAIDWFFTQEESGLILEDDCVPSSSFFPFCEELLARYRDEPRVMMISGNNFQEGRCVGSASYYFSKYSHTWGWATWRRAWKLFDAQMAGWPAFRTSGKLQAFADGNRYFEPFWRHVFDATQSGHIVAWDYVWLLTCWMHDGLTCIPGRNLVKNIGFGAGATHTSDPSTWLAGIPLETVDFPLRHPDGYQRAVAADARADLRVFRISAIRMMLRKLVARFPRLYRLGYRLRGVRLPSDGATQRPIVSQSK